MCTKMSGTQHMPDLRAGLKFEILSSNALFGDCSRYCLSTEAISEGQLFIRTSSSLRAIGERNAEKQR